MPHCTPTAHIYTDCTPGTCRVAHAEAYGTAQRSSVGYDAD